MASLSRTLSVLTLGLGTTLAKDALTKQPKAPNTSALDALLAAPPTGTAMSNVDAARRRNQRRQAAAGRPQTRPTILTGALGLSDRAPVQRASLLGS